MGLEDMIEEVKDVATGQGGNDSNNDANNSDGSNKKTEDTMIDSGNATLTLRPSNPFMMSNNTLLTVLFAVIDQFATKEGVPAGFDPEINNIVNDEINKF